MAIHLKLRDGIVDAIQADHAIDVLYTLYALGVHPPAIEKKELNRRMEAWHEWVTLEPVEAGDDPDDDDDGGESVKPGGEPG